MILLAWYLKWLTDLMIFIGNFHVYLLTATYSGMPFSIAAVLVQYSENIDVR